MKKAALHNLGCKVNSYEIDVMQQSLVDKGYEIVPFDAKADIYIVNTCSVTNMADRKSRQMLHRAKMLNPQAVVVAVGCYVQTAGEALLQDACVDLVIGNNKKKDLLAILEAYLAKHHVECKEESVREPAKHQQCTAMAEAAEAVKEDKTLGNTTVIDINKPCDYEEMTLTQTAEHTRAYIKIQDGCNQFCSYCIIPYARGRVRSRKAEDIIREIQGIVDAGYKEIVLTGIHISSYGIDLEDEAWSRGESVRAFRAEGQSDYRGQSKLIDLVEKIHAIPGVKRLRIGSLEPRIITRESANRLAALEKVCPHFHLSLQSGCDETLKRMNRHYTTGEYSESVKHLRNAFDHPAITTDVIVGFPGETEEEFETSAAFLEEICFYEMHIFKYSKRKGTRAAAMKDQVPDPEKTRRSNRLLAMEKAASKAFRARYIGKETAVLFEETKEIAGQICQLGHTVDYVKVALPCKEELTNCIRTVKVTDFLTDEILLSRDLI